MSKYCFIQIDMDDNQWVIPRQQGRSYDIFNSDAFLKAAENIKKYLGRYPLTLFLVGLDMKVAKKVEKIKELLADCAKIEIANHSLSHFNAFNRLPRDEKKKEIMDSDHIIKEALGLRRVYGFRSPGYVYDDSFIEILKAGGYTYDSSLFPSYFAPVLRMLNSLINRVSTVDNFGCFKNGFLPNEPMPLDKERSFFEVNISVCPFLRLPIHYSIIKSRKAYGMLSPLINRIECLNFLFHLSDFMNIDTERLEYVLSLITRQRDVILSRDINSVCAGR